MKYQSIGKALFVRNRQKFIKQLKPESVALLHSSDVMPTSADGTLPFKQDANIFYLSGIDQEESVLLLAPDFPDEKYREVLFLRETSPEMAVWEGHKYTKEEAKTTSGIRSVMWLDDFESTLNMVLAETENIYLDSNEHVRNTSQVATRTDRFTDWCQSNYKTHHYQRMAPVLYGLRCMKEPEEIELLQRACDITEVGFRRILEVVKPGVWEYELEAEFCYEFLRNRATGFAYSPIIASGNNSCVLHYIENNRQCKDDGVILFDVGAEYANYNADMTRVVPINGKFSKRQKDIYNAVLRIKDEATQLLIPKSTIPEYHKAVGEIMGRELIALGLISMRDIEKQDPDKPAYKKYFMHGTSHHLGLSVHDVASVYTQFEPGMVLTVEPGIYVPEEGIGIRLEDDIVITEDSHINLMKNIPIHAEEIESLMNK